MWSRLHRLACAGVVLLTTALHADAATADYDKGVLVLNETNFEAAVKKFPILMVKFYAPWCGHCQQLAPIYERAARTVKKQAALARLSKVDATTEGGRALAEKHRVEGFPTIITFKDGEVTLSELIRLRPFPKSSQESRGSEISRGALEKGHLQIMSEIDFRICDKFATILHTLSVMHETKHHQFCEFGAPFATNLCNAPRANAPLLEISEWTLCVAAFCKEIPRERFPKHHGLADRVVATQKGHVNWTGLVSRTDMAGKPLRAPNGVFQTVFFRFLTSACDGGKPFRGTNNV